MRCFCVACHVVAEGTALYDGREREWGQVDYNKEWKTSDEAQSYQTGSSEVLESSKTPTQTSSATTTKCGQGDSAISTVSSRNRSSCKGFCTGHHGIANFPAVRLTEDGGSREVEREIGSDGSSQEPRAAAHRRTAGGEPAYTSCTWHSVAVRCKCAGEARY